MSATIHIQRRGERQIKAAVFDGERWTCADDDDLAQFLNDLTEGVPLKGYWPDTVNGRAQETVAMLQELGIAAEFVESDPLESSDSEGVVF